MIRPTLLLLPGMLNTGAIFDRIAPFVAPLADLRIVEGLTQDSMPAMARHGWTAAGDGPVWLAGFSMGGHVAIEMLAQRPEKVAGLALIDASIGVDGAALAPMREKTIAAAGRNFTNVCERSIEVALDPSRRKDAELKAIMRPMMKAIGLSGFVAQMRAVMGRSDHRFALASFRGSATVICGRNDAVFPLFWSEEAAAAIPGATLTIIENAGHLTPIEQPAAVAAALRVWLATPAIRERARLEAAE